MKLDTTISTRVLIAVLKAVSAVTDECTLQCSHEGISISMIDASNAAMVVIDMPPAIFGTFEAEEGQIGLDTREVLVKASTFDDDTILSMSFDDYNKRIVIAGEGARYGIRTMPVASLRKTPNLPNLDLPLEVEIGADRFRQMIKRSGLVSDHIMIGYNDGLSFFVSSEGDMDNFEQGTLDHPIKIIYKSDLVTLYSIDMLEPMAKMTTEIVNLRLGRDLPLVMLFDLEGVAVTYLLAPRIEKANEGPEV